MRGLHWGVFLEKVLELMGGLLIEVKFSSLEGLSYVLLLVSQRGGLLVILWKIHWEEYLSQIVELTEAPPLGYHMVLLIEVVCLVDEWGSLLVSCVGYIL